jgi:hypothetical protein
MLLFLGLAMWNEAARFDGDQLRFHAGWLILSVVGFAAFQVAHMELWRLQMHALGHDVPRARSYAVWSVSTVARYVPTSMLMPTLRVALAQRAGIPKRITLASLVYEGALALAGAVMVAAYFLIELPALQDRSARWLILALPVLALVALHPRLFGPGTAFALRRAGRRPLPLTLPAPRLLLLATMYAGSFVLAGASLYALTQALYPWERRICRRFSVPSPSASAPRYLPSSSLEGSARERSHWWLRSPPRCPPRLRWR